MDELLDRLRGTPGLAPLVAEAVTTWRRRAGAAGPDVTGDDVTGPDIMGHGNGGGDGGGGGGQDEPEWRAFSDAFPTFWEFTNRPR